MITVFHKSKDEIGRIHLGVAYYMFGEEKFVPEYRDFDYVVHAQRWLLKAKSDLLLHNFNRIIDSVAWIRDTDEMNALVSRVSAALKWASENIHDYSAVVKNLTKVCDFLQIMLKNVQQADYHRALMMVSLFQKFIFDEYETIKAKMS